jgi:hypothetical protein
MADWHFAQATSWAELREAHERWVAAYNYQVHWAHREREDGRRSSAEVLSWVTGTVSSEEELRRLFTLRFARRRIKVATSGSATGGSTASAVWPASTERSGCTGRT